MKTIFVMVKCDLGKAYEVADAAVQTSKRCRRSIRPPGNTIC